MGKRISQVFAGITRFPSDSHSLRLYCAVANGAGSQSRPEYPRDQCVPWRERWRAQFQEHTLIGPQPTIITFDGPGSGTGPGQGTIAFAINAAGTISGRYADAGGAIHAILRYPNGAIIAFDAPGAGTGPRQGTRPFSINPAGATAGYYNDASGVFHGFLRTPDGVITTFNVPGAGTAPAEGTFAGNINPLGAIAGRYVDASDVAHGFLRTPDGTFTTFDAPNAGTGPGQAPLFLPAFASIPQGRSRELRLTRAMCITACYALRTAPSLRSIFRAREQARFKAHSRSGSTRPERLRETILTRMM